MFVASTSSNSIVAASLWGVFFVHVPDYFHPPIESLTTPSPVRSSRSEPILTRPMCLNLSLQALNETDTRILSYGSLGKLSTSVIMILTACIPKKNKRR